MTDLYLVRHGETDWNRQRRIQGLTDIPLNDTGRAQAEAAAALIERSEWDLVVSSTLGRARETAAILARGLGLPVAGAVLQEVIDVAVIVNALRARHAGREADGLGTRLAATPRK